MTTMTSATTALLRVVLIASLAAAAGACRPTFTCAPSLHGAPLRGAGGQPASCRATWACTFTLCSPGQTCTMGFAMDAGTAIAEPTGGAPVAFNFSSAPGSLLGGSFGGDQTCGAAGCSDNVLSLVFQSVDRTSGFETAPCEVKETPATCTVGGDRRRPIPASPPMPMVTAKLLCENSVLPCAGFKARAEVAFRADVAWPEPPPPPPVPNSPPPAPVSPPISPPLPPAAPPPPGAFAPGGAGRRGVLGVLGVAAVFVASYAALGYAYVWLLVRDRVPREMDASLRRLTPYR